MDMRVNKKGTIMANSYYQIAGQINKDERSKHYNIFLNDADEAQEMLNNEQFRHIYSVLRNKYQVIYKLFGEENFKRLSFEYFKYNPVQSVKLENYGKSFGDFIGSLPQLSEYKYLKWIAKLDWFWFNPVEEGSTIQLPKGTLNSWASIYKDQNSIEILIDEAIIENLQIQKIGKEIQIVAI